MTTREARASIVATILLIAGGAICAPVLHAETAPEPTVELRWALGATERAGSTPSAVTRDTELETGARLKFLVEPLSPASVYLILQDSSDDIHLLYRHDGSKEAGGPAYLPPDAHWFELDEQEGSETFFLLASVEPLRELEELLERHDAADAGAKPGLASEIVEEIRRLHRAHRNFARPAEKPVMIGGRTRGDTSGTSAIDRLAVEISAQRFYGKTITIDH